VDNSTGGTFASHGDTKVHALDSWVFVRIDHHVTLSFSFSPEAVVSLGMNNVLLVF
jgi:hypothetical protein